MDTTQAPAPEPDMIAQVGEMIARVARCEYSVDTKIDLSEDADIAILVASAILAVAAELRAVRNELSDWQRAWMVRQ